MVVIDLGESYLEPQVDVPRVRSGGLPRWPWLLGVLALLITTLAAAAPLPTDPAPVVVVPARLGAIPVYGDGRLFLVDPVGVPGVSDPQIAAFRLPGGEPLWRMPVPLAVRAVGQSGPGGLFTTSVGDRLVLSAATPAHPAGETLVLDAATGAARWRADGDFVGATASGDLLLSEGQVDRAPGLVGPETLRAVDPATGAPRWTYRLPEGIRPTYHSVDRGLDLAVTQLATGRVQLLDLTSGRVIAARDLPPPGSAAVADARWSPEIAGDLLLLWGADLSTLSAYDLDGLEHRWTVPREEGDGYWPVPCGDHLLCFQRDERGLRVLDARTGQTRWSDNRWGQLAQAGDYLLVSPTWTPSAVSVLDAATGRVLAELGTWRLVGWVDDVDQTPDSASRALGIRSGRHGQTWLATLDPAAGTVEIMDVITGVSGDCVAGQSVLTCRRLDGSLGLWRLPG